MKSTKVIIDQNGFWHIHKTCKITGKKFISVFKSLKEARASIKRRVN